MRWNLVTKSCRLAALSAWLALIAIAIAFPAWADDAVRLRMLVIATGTEVEDAGLAYIRPVLDVIGIPYDILDARRQDLAPAALASLPMGDGCQAEDAGCTGRYNGVILTQAGLVPEFTPAEWDALHRYQKDFGVRAAVLAGRAVTYSDPAPPHGVYLDYGLAHAASRSGLEAQWTIPAAYDHEVFEYVNRAYPLSIAGPAHPAHPRQPPGSLRDGSRPQVEVLLKTPDGAALVSVVRYVMPDQEKPVREVMISTIDNASSHLHSSVLAYELINWAAQGVFVGARYVHLAVHLDDLFRRNTLWDVDLNRDNPATTYRLNSGDIANAVDRQNAFRAAHPLVADFKLDFAFNGSGAVVDAAAMPLAANLKEDLVSAVVANRASFRFINHTFAHSDMDKAPAFPGTPCDYATFSSVAAAQADINRNRVIWALLDLPEREPNRRVLVTGSHSGLRDRRCTDISAAHADMSDVQADDVAFDAGGANPLFLEAAARAGVDYLAADASQRSQDIEQYIARYDDRSPKDRLMLPRWPTNVFYNVTHPSQLEDEYNHAYHGRFVDAGQNPCRIPGALCVPRSYREILEAEADKGLRHMLTFSRWPHFFHQANLARYDESGHTLQFDWLDAVLVRYERLFTLPVRNLPYYLIGDRTAQSLAARSAVIHAIWNRTTGQVTLSADRALPHLRVTGLAGGERYGGQSIREVAVDTHPRTYPVDRGLEW